MKVDIEHVLFWMDAIRNSEDRYRTLESFWKGQVYSKLWLIKELSQHIEQAGTIVIHGGWNGVLASLLFQSSIEIGKIVSIDIDESCRETANTVNKIEEMQGRFSSVTCDMAEYEYQVTPSVVINTSCEHVAQETYERWLEKVPNESLIVLQSNDYFDLQEHMRCAVDLDDFEKQSNIRAIHSAVLQLPKYKRFMLIGYKNVSV